MARLAGLLVFAAIVVGCGGGSKEPAGPASAGSPGPSEGTPPVGPTPPAPPAPDPISLGPGLPSVTPTVCAAARELPAPPPPGSCARPLALGEPEALSVVHRCAPGLGCPYDCGEVAVNARGDVAWWAIQRLGGGGYATGTVSLLGPGGNVPVTASGGTQPVFGVGEAFLRAGRMPTVSRVDPTGAQGEVALAWGMGWGPWFWPSWYAAPLAEGTDGGDRLAVAVTGLAESGDLEVWAAAVRGDGSVATAPFRVLALPPGESSWGAAPSRVVELAVTGLAVGVDHAGRILVLWDGPPACAGGGAAGRWYGPDGGAVSEPFRAADALPGGARLVPLPGGGLALRDATGNWPRRFEGPDAAAGPAPAWLAARAGETLTLVGGGLAVAARGSTELATPPRLELVDGTGAVCAAATLPPQEPGHTPAHPAIGADGTVVQFAGAVPIPLPSNTLECRFRRWRAAMR